MVVLEVIPAADYCLIIYPQPVGKNEERRPVLEKYYSGLLLGS
jgi:hypothetical protein